MTEVSYWAPRIGGGMISHGGEKIFFVSPQRSGTKSFGEIMRRSGRVVCSWPDTRHAGLDAMWFTRNIERLDAAIEKFEAFEDYPFYEFEFVRTAIFRWPGARFVLLDRDPDDWFESMVVHSDGFNPGDSTVHAATYDRWVDLEQVLANVGSTVGRTRLLDIAQMKSHYTSWYLEHSARVRALFSVMGQNDRLFHSSWAGLDLSALGDFLGAGPIESAPTHVHASKGKVDLLSRVYARRSGP